MQNGLLLELSRQVDLAEAEDTLVGAGANVRHRFKVTLPLLLWFLSYEGEVEWEGRGWEPGGRAGPAVHAVAQRIFRR